MKKIFLLYFTLLAFTTLRAQEFNTQLATARSSYTSGKLDDSRFAMQQMLQEIDIVIGKEVLKLLPTTMDVQKMNSAKDNVSGASNFFGVMIHRDYGPEDKNISVEIISNSPMITSINAILSLPIMGASGDQKVVRVSGYKALMTKSGEAEKPEFELQIPLNNSLITLRAPGYTSDQVSKMAAALPLDKIAKMLQ